ncbi:MAG: hypothetical protein GF308_00855 [Candidatus Heimdallarchaeota archaeon]|nr:hypothetical protein [Candidatus Heimdallarchaeota archaeon]
MSDPFEDYEVELLTRIFTDSVRDLAFSPNGKYLAAAIEDKTARVFRTHHWSQPLVTLRHDYGVYSVAWSPDSQFLATGSIYCPVKIWRVLDCSKVFTLQKSGYAINLDWSSNGKYLAVGNYSPDDRKTSVEVWNTATWEQVSANNDYCPWYVAFSPDSSLLALQYGTEGIEILSVPDFSREVFLDFSYSEKYGELFHPAWSSDMSFLAASCGDGRIRVWRTSDWSVIVTRQLHECWEGGTYETSFSPNGKFLISGGVGALKLLSTQNWRIIHIFEKGAIGDYLSLAWSPNSPLLASAVKMGIPIEIWKVS